LDGGKGAAERQLSLSELVAVVDHDRGEVGNLSSALRCFVLSRYYVPAAASAASV
jgi:predicted DNA-binding ribbon-helix-helix protein